MVSELFWRALKFLRNITGLLLPVSAQNSLTAIVWFVRPLQSSCWNQIPSVGGRAKGEVFGPWGQIPHEWLGALLGVMSEFLLLLVSWELVVKKNWACPSSLASSLALWSLHILAPLHLPQWMKQPETLTRCRWSREVPHKKGHASCRAYRTMSKINLFYL